MGKKNQVKPVIFIVSGGQTGADRGALEGAKACDIPHFGYCPKDRRAEDGPIPKQFNMIELVESDYEPRTQMNIWVSDGTLVILDDEPGAGTRLTLKLAGDKAYKVRIDKITKDTFYNEVGKIADWVMKNEIKILNVAGGRESRHRGIQEKTRVIVRNLIRELEKRNAVKKVPAKAISQAA